MSFKELKKPTFFVASPGDVSETRQAVKTMFKNLCRQTANDKGIELYAWESEISKSGFDQWSPAAVQIPLPSDPLCKAVFFIFGERIGTPVTDKPSHDRIRDLISKESIQIRNGNYHLKLDWENGAEDDGAFPLTGTVFELLDTLAKHKDSPGTLPFRIIIIGDESVLDALNSESITKTEDANWGDGNFYKTNQSKVKPRELGLWSQEYNSQIRQLRNLLGYLLGCLRESGSTIDKSWIAHSPKDAGEICEAFLKEKFGYKTDGNPFKGLAFYDSKDDQIFFGRDEWLKTALEEFEGCWSKPYVPFYGIVGSSGAGKSSLLRAGMIARLENSDKYNPYKVSVFSAADFNFSKKEERTAPKSFSETPLGYLLKKVLSEILKKRSVDESSSDSDTPRANTREKNEKTIARILNELGREAFSKVRPQMAVSQLISELDKCAEQSNISPPEKLRLVIGLDQFEELLDYHNSDKNDDKALEPVFEFFQEACESGRIGFVYTCQKNRLKILTNDAQLTPLIERSRRNNVSPLTDYEIKDLIRQMFFQVEIRLSEEIITELLKHINNFTEMLDLTRPAQESHEDSKSALLPLLSLTLYNLYEHCQNRREELQQKQKEQKLESDKDSAADFNQATSGSQSKNNDSLLNINLKNITRSILNVENAIKEQIDKGLSATLNTPRINWSEDVLKSLLRRLIRIHSDGLYHPQPISVPKRGGGKVLVEQFLKNRLLVPDSSDSDKIRLVHEAVIRNWKAAEEWIEKEKELLEAYNNKFKSFVEAWQINTSDEAFQNLGTERLELAGKFLHSWWDVFKPNDGTQPSPEDQALLEFSFFLLEAAMTPGKSIKGDDFEITHFLTAVYYGRKELVEKYLEMEPTAAKEHRAGKGSGAAYGAVFSQDIEMLELVLKNGADALLTNSENKQPIHLAAITGNIPILSRLVEAGADPAISGENDWTALNIAAFNDDIAMARHLLNSYKIAINLPNSNGWIPFHTACLHSSPELLKELLTQPDIDVTSPTKDNWLPFHIAIYNRSPDTISVLLQDERIDRTTATPTKKSPVELVIDEVKTQSGEVNLSLLKAILDDPFKKVDPDALGAEKTYTPLYKACFGGNADLVDLLVKNGADANWKSLNRETTPFLLAAERGEDEILQILLPYADFRLSNSNKRSALHLAALNGHTQIVKTLLEYLDSHEEDLAALIRAYDAFGFAPIHLAAATGSIEVVKLLAVLDEELLSFGDEAGRKIAHLACEHNQRDFLLQLGADFDPQVLDNQGMNVLHYAARFGRIEVVKELLERETVDLNACDNFGWTALHMSAQNGHFEVVKELLRKKAKSVAGINPPLSALQAAAAAGQTEVVELLFSEFTENENDPSFFDKTLFLAVKNAQFETASKLLTIQYGETGI